MMPSTVVLDHVILYHDKSKKFITNDQAKFIYEASAAGGKSVTTKALGLISFSAIAKLVTIEEYYDQYPDERPEKPREWQPENRPQYSIEQMALADKVRRDSLIGGLRKCINERKARGETTTMAEMTLRQWENTVKPEQKEVAYFSGVCRLYENRDYETLTVSEKQHLDFAREKVAKANAVDNSKP